MKNLLLFSLFAIIIGGIYFTVTSETIPRYPVPTNKTFVKMDMEDGSRSGRSEWIEAMHRTAPNVNWKDIEYNNAKESARYKSELRKLAINRDPGEEETIVDEYLRGIWYERGSSNQAGSAIALDYLLDLDEIFLISAGGTLWKGNRDGSEWTVLNQDYKFSNRFLEVFEHQGGHRIISAIEGRVHYSDDMGATWIASEGMISPNQGWNIKHATTILDSTGAEELFLFFRDGWWSNIQLYRSKDQGVSFETVAQFNTSDFDNFAMTNPHGTQDLYLIEQLSASSSNLLQWNPLTEKLKMRNANIPFSFKNGRGNLVGADIGTDTLLYAYGPNDDPEPMTQLFVSSDFGTTWEGRKVFVERPWEVGVYISPSDPTNLFTGGVNGYRSHDGGVSFILKNEWWEYYDFVDTKLHADIMFYAEFNDPNGDPFLLNVNHGGLYISYDQGRNYQNISLEGLNIGQYYSVRSHPAVPDFVYAGAQDQGFQRGLLNEENTASPLEQVISGDYGHIIFTQSGNKLWTVYPGGWVTYYADPIQGGVTSSYEIISPNESVWIPPMMPHPDETKNIAYVAGGNVDELPGAHIIQLEVVGSNINASAMPFDFSSYGSISAMKVNPFNHDLWYVATDSGRFLYSEDGGQTFVNSTGNVPDGHYLYGSDILASKLVDNQLFLCGSGYSNPGVLKSEDGGKTFTAMSNGLPSTMVFGLAANEDESMIFAATETGPFVYITELDEWFNLSGTTAPLQTYWSVEYIPSQNIARFGTYGRGIWDFEVTGSYTSTEESSAENEIVLFPNPTSDFINVRGVDDAGIVTILSSTGQVILSQNYNANNPKIHVGNLPAGNYFLTFRSEKLNEIKQFVKVD